MAHHIAVAARRVSFAPRRLVLIDPNPPIAGKAPNLHQAALRDTMLHLVITLLASAAVHGESDELIEIGRTAEQELRPCTSDADAATRATQLLAAQGVLPDKLESMTRFLRQAQILNQGTMLLRQQLARNVPPLSPPWQTLLLLASERSQFFAGFEYTTPETTGTHTARLYGGIAYELTLIGTHLAVAQQCASGEYTDFNTTLRSFLADTSLPSRELALHSIASAEAVVTSIALDGPRFKTIRQLHTPIVFVLSSPRSGSSLLQLCLQAHQVRTHRTLGLAYGHAHAVSASPLVLCASRHLRRRCTLARSFIFASLRPSMSDVCCARLSCSTGSSRPSRS